MCGEARLHWSDKNFFCGYAAGSVDEKTAAEPREIGRVGRKSLAFPQIGGHSPIVD